MAEQPQDKIDIKELLTQMDKPIELSANEVEKIEEIFNQLRSHMNEYEAEVLKQTRDEAFTSVRRLLSNVDTAINQAVTIAPGQTRIIPLAHIDQDGEAQHTPVPQAVLPPKVDFQALLDSLPENIRTIANRMDCVTQFNDPDIGQDIVCTHCSPKAMLSCIRLIDPSVPETDLKRIEDYYGARMTKKKEV